MEQGVTLDQVQQAINHLRQQGERVSRRNVRAITGGGMSTVHRLMGLVEEQEVIQGSVSTEGLSEACVKALRLEIGNHVSAATESCQKQIVLLKAREQEVLDALETSEVKAALLDSELTVQKEQNARERQEAEKSLAVALESIRRLEKWVGDYLNERRELNKTIDAVKAENITFKLHVGTLGETLTKAEKSVDRFSLELTKTQRALAEAEKKAAVAQQKANDLKDALARLERV
jgi:chromosome segregation ATPase